MFLGFYSQSTDAEAALLHLLQQELLREDRWALVGWGRYGLHILDHGLWAAQVTVALRCRLHKVRDDVRCRGVVQPGVQGQRVTHGLCGRSAEGEHG